MWLLGSVWFGLDCVSCLGTDSLLRGWVFFFLTVVRLWSARLARSRALFGWGRVGLWREGGRQDGDVAELWGGEGCGEGGVWRGWGGRSVVQWRRSGAEGGVGGGGNREMLSGSGCG